MNLPIFSAIFAGLALSLYVLLDGFDLGVGVLLLAQPDGNLRDRMVDSIIPTWDGNETWLIMAGVALLAAFPVAYGVLLPAFYIPLITMLLALGLRGVSFEFRYQTVAGRRAWDVVFGMGSIVAAAMQGLITGGLIQGVSVDRETFSGSVFDVFRPFPCLVATAVVAGYVVLGAAWLHLKAKSHLRNFAERVLRRALPTLVGLVAAACVEAATVQPELKAALIARNLYALPIGILFLGVAFALVRSVGGSADGRPFFLALVLIALILGGIGIVVYPDIVPFRMTLWEAASSSRSHVFLLVGASIVTPVVLCYSAFAYRVFRGKTPETGWES